MNDLDDLWKWLAQWPGYIWTSLTAIVLALFALLHARRNWKTGIRISSYREHVAARKKQRRAWKAIHAEYSELIDERWDRFTTHYFSGEQPLRVNQPRIRDHADAFSRHLDSFRQRLTDVGADAAHDSDSAIAGLLVEYYGLVGSILSLLALAASTDHSHYVEEVSHRIEQDDSRVNALAGEIEACLNQDIGATEEKIELTVR